MNKLAAFILFGILMFTTVACDNNKNNDDKQSKEPVYGIISEELLVGKGTEWELSGILTMPEDVAAKVPAVVLVHGSGPSDMDEKINDNKPFLEIAEYLTSRGIAVIRYNKRTFTHGAKMVQQLGGNMTMYDETIEDAILATNILKSDPRIDENRVYILGHSLGGSLAPRINALGGDYAGLILFAGTPRSLIEVIASQQVLYYTETMEGEALEAILASVDSSVKQQIAAIINMSDDEAKAVIDSSGASLYYYKDNLINSTENYIKDITAPFLVMQADNDFQVFTDKDFGMYKELLANRSNVTFKLYEGLNHLFMPSTATRSIDIQDEYKIKANIDKQVLQDIVDWIRAN